MTREEIFKTDEYKELMRKYIGAQKCLEELDGKLRAAETMSQMLMKGGAQWEQQKIMQEQIVQHQIGNSDSTVKKLEAEVIELREEIKVLKAGAK